MIAVIAEALRQTFTLLREARWTDWRWLALIIISLVLQIPFDDLGLIDLEDPTGMAATFAIVTGIFGVIWFMTRQLGDQNTHHLGAFWPWLGWTFASIIVFLPFFAVYIYFEMHEWAFDLSPRAWLETMLLSLAVGLSAPFLVKATSVAINRDIIWSKEISPFVYRNLIPLMAGHFLVIACFAVPAHYFDVRLASLELGQAETWVYALLSGVIWSAQTVFGTAYLVACVQMALHHNEDAQLPREAELS